VVRIPESDDEFRWRIGRPFGKEVILLYGSKVPVQAFSGLTSKGARFIPVPEAALNGALRDLGGQPASEWGFRRIEIVTAPRNEPPTAQEPKCYGIFFGIREYEFNAEVKGGNSELNLPVPGKMWNCIPTRWKPWET
jgi:hypothetical protein